MAMRGTRLTTYWPPVMSHGLRLMASCVSAAPDSPPRSGVRIIDESTGMVGIPAIEVDETTQNPGGVTGFILDATEPITDALGNILGGGAPVRGDVRVSVQLNPGIQLDEEIEVRSRVLVGRYDVVSLQHVGSTRDGEWVTMILGQGLDTEPAPV